MKLFKLWFITLFLIISLGILCSCGGEQGPVGPQGEQGIQGIQGVQGERGPQGEPGVQGIQGEQGLRGETGNTGAKGEPGKDGTSLLNGNGAPDAKLGNVGDTYIDLNSWDFYVKTNDGWIVRGNIKGEDGEDAIAEHDGTDGLIFYPINDNECAVGIGTAIYAKEIVVPAKYKQYTVTTVAKGAFGFSSAPAMERIELPDTITTIEESAFSSCKKLKEINLPDSITYIGGSAFRNCSSLEEIRLPEELESINSLFEGCTSLKSVEIPDSVTAISSGSFSGCSALTSLVIKDGVVFTGNYVFYDCPNLTLFCEAESASADWYPGWDSMFEGDIYWAGEWNYDVSGNPSPIINKDDDDLNGKYGLSHIVIEDIYNSTENICYTGDSFFGMILSPDTISVTLNNGTGVLSYTFESTVTTNITYEIVDDKFIMHCEEAIDLHNDGNPKDVYELFIEEIDGVTYFVLKSQNGNYKFSYCVVKK